MLKKIYNRVLHSGPAGKVFMAQTGATALGVLFSIPIARFLGPNERGLLAFALILMTIPMFTTFSLGTATNYFISSKQFTIKEAGFSSVVVGTVMGFITGLVILALWWLGLLGNVGSHFSGFVIVLIVLGALLQGMSLILPRLFLAADDYNLFNLNNFIQRAVVSFGMAVAVIGFGVGYVGALVWQVIAWFLLAIAGYAILQYKHKLDAKISLPFLRKAIPYGLSTWAGESLNNRNIRPEQYFLAGFASPAVVGLYAVSLQIAEFLHLIGNSIGIATFNQVSAAKDDSELNQIVRTSLKKTFLWSFIGAAAVAVGTIIFVPVLYGPAYKDSVYIVLLLIPSTIAYNVVTILFRVLQSSGRSLLASVLSIGGTALAILLYFLFVPKYLALGAALTTSIATVALAVLVYYITKIKLSRPNST